MANKRRVTKHASNPWDASISDLFNNDNWSQQYDGTNPKSDNPMRSGNWYTPGSGGSAPVNTVQTAAGGSAINQDSRVQELANQFRNDVWRDRPPQTVVPVDSLDTQDRLDIPFRVDQSQDVTPKPEDGGWDFESLFGAGRDLYDSAKGGAKDAFDYVSNSDVGQAIGDGLAWRPEPTQLSPDGVMPDGSSTLGKTYSDSMQVNGIIDSITQPYTPFGEDNFSAERAIYQQLIAADPTMRPSLAAKEAAFRTGRLPRPIEGATAEDGGNPYTDNIYDPINKWASSGGIQRGWKYMKNLGN